MHIQEIVDGAKDQFINIAKSSGIDHPEEFFEVQKALFFDRLKVLNENSYTAGKLADCSDQSKKSAFLTAALFGLSFELGEPVQLYLYPSFGNTLKATPSAVGWATCLVKKGFILSVDEPTVVYKDDEYLRIKTENGSTVIEHSANLLQGDRKAIDIVAVYTKVTRRDGSSFYSYMTKDQFGKIKEKSIKGSAKAQAEKQKVWEEIGMYKTKCLKFALKGIARATALPMDEYEHEISELQEAEKTSLDKPEIVEPTDAEEVDILTASNDGLDLDF